MGYIRAEEILPAEVLELVQQYVDGRNIYIPQKAENRREGGRTENAFCGCKRDLIGTKRHEPIPGVHPWLHLL